MQQKIEEKIAQIKKVYSFEIKSEQKDQLEICEDNLCNESESSQNLFEKIVSIQRRIENKYKHNMTDIDAFYWKTNKLSQTDYPSVFDMLNIKNKNQLIDNSIGNIKFSVLSFPTSDLVGYATNMLLKNEFVSKNWNKDIVNQLITKISENYNIVSYHNFSHAFSLSLLCYQCFENQPSLKLTFSQEQYFYILIAGLSHDLNHHGTNNSFQVKNKTKHAINAGNISVLEKYHVQCLWEILKENPNINFLKDDTDNKGKKFITNLILATDVAFHFNNLEKFMKKKNSQNGLCFNNHQDKMLAIEQLFHACDIGNLCLETQDYLNWAILLSYEFNQQTKLQTKNNVEVTQMLKYKGVQAFYAGQIGFTNALVLPLWKQLACVWPGLQIYTKNIQNNLVYLQHKKQQSKSQ